METTKRAGIREQLRMAEDTIVRLTKELKDQEKLTELYKKWYNDSLTVAEKTRVSHKAEIDRRQTAIVSMMRTLSEMHEMIVDASLGDTNPTHAWLREMRAKILAAMSRDTLELAFPNRSLDWTTLMLVGASIIPVILGGLGMLGVYAKSLPVTEKAP